MSLTDPVADMLTRLRNALQAKKKDVNIPSSRMKVEIAKILKDEGYIKNFRVTEDSKQGILNLTLKYTNENESVITE
ncbi:MAG: 30S ribosomal protein S8, partial [Candidatus Aminicenantes bacterium]